MNLSSRCKTCFDSKTAFRGREYFHYRHVKFRNFSGHSAKFSVRGSYPRPYEVYLDWSHVETGEFLGECDCPHYKDGALCKHIWACLLWVDQAPFGKRFSGLSKLRVVHRQNFNDQAELKISPEQRTWEEIHSDPQVKARVSFSKGPPAGALRVRLAFRYGDEWIDSTYVRPAVVAPVQKRIYVRNIAAETEAQSKLTPWGTILNERATDLINEMIGWNWIVEAEGKSVVSMKGFETKISSGVDWFDLTAQVKYGEMTIGVAELIESLDQGEKWIKLGDGNFGMIPEQWVRRHAALASIGVKKGEAVRFKTAQAVVLDGWLQDEPELKTDAKFQDIRNKLKAFDGLREGLPTKDFKGVLRSYQQQGISWLEFLAEFELGGVLADDMGLGKTVQVLAFLQKKISEQKKSERLPSLIIVPKSLIHNWTDEATKFVPDLKVINYSGATRRALLPEFSKANLILTTYQTLRLDVDTLKESHFYYVVADEAQAIKNGEAQIAKACKKIPSRHKLAMTGTPIENSVEDLFSILDFVNPGWISNRLRGRFSMGGPNSIAEEKETLRTLSKALKPVILRRTKEQVLKELPEKTEQTLFCELSKEEQKNYQGLRDHYRRALDHEIEKSGIGKAKIQILTALLRLRQAACHPALIDPKKSKETSAKLETLLEQTQEVIHEGHKVLIFSQFTSFLAVVQESLKSRAIDFEYLDGKTRNRREPVDRFQNDPGCKVFLLSLKAGGTGLNLTAADYVFLLDPWWNPAVEKQAIDRAHRIGQHRNVFAYRLIARGTVEEKILELQKNKRELADAIISEDANFLKKMTREDLNLLLS